MQIANQTQKFWNDARRLATQLDPEAHKRDLLEKEINPQWKHEFVEASKKPIYLISLEANELAALDPNHEDRYNMCLCAPWTAAKALTVGTHRRATPEEAQAWEARQAAQRVRIEEDITKRERAAGMAMANALKSALGVAQEAEAPVSRRAVK